MAVPVHRAMDPGWCNASLLHQIPEIALCNRRITDRADAARSIVGISNYALDFFDGLRQLVARNLCTGLFAKWIDVWTGHVCIVAHGLAPLPGHP